MATPSHTPMEGARSLERSASLASTDAFFARDTVTSSCDSKQTMTPSCKQRGRVETQTKDESKSKRDSCPFLPFPFSADHGGMARGGRGLPKVSCVTAMPNPSTPSRRATPETALRLFQGWLGQPRAVFYPFGHPTPYASTADVPPLEPCVTDFLEADIFSSWASRDQIPKKRRRNGESVKKERRRTVCLGGCRD
jgi:hypothetical protein